MLGAPRRARIPRRDLVSGRGGRFLVRRDGCDRWCSHHHL